MKIKFRYWRERRLISRLYMDQSVKLKLEQDEKISVKNGRGVRHGRCLSPILLNFTANILTRRLLK